ncbi:hypothetical protein Rmet_6517 [Cupriavidus metallidurans CH34]|uniref:Uncharacterized protein n=1 Tax=Cupriavidus metallidurans (strain ATCC 43123 / DSM 2839 / NBRC 102507 / CH34) TaxID=266264 RepID=D3DXV5_CUPMC|nr:hypothetical protein Rmet_6517 [Cupriavidus metallidurans CH34]
MSGRKGCDVETTETLTPEKGRARKGVRDVQV